MGNKRGEITVFLSMVFLCLISLMCGLIESARTAGARYYLKTAADSAMDSVFSGYHRAVWKDYRMFFREFEDEEDLAEEWSGYLKPYEEEHGWYPFKMSSAETEQLVRITDEGGRYIEQEILDYMQYGIWDISMDEIQAGDLLENLKEAGAAGEISKAYGKHTREAVRLEKALEALAENLKVQEKIAGEAGSCLSAWDGSGFRRAAGKLRKEMEKLPGLVKIYTKRADDLAGGLEQTKRELAEKREELSGSVKAAVEEEVEAYDSYVAQDGERRQEVEGLWEKEKGNQSVMEAATDRSHEVEDIIGEWENSHEEDEEGPDEGALWDDVTSVWNGLQIPGLSCSFGVRDKEKEGLLEEIRKMTDFDLLKLVLPEGKEVSGVVLDTTGFPSLSLSDGEQGEAGLLNRLLTDEYIGRFLTDFLSTEEKPVQCEQEYVIAGKNSDEGNLRETVKSLLLMREGMNLIHILSDPEKRQEARGLAAVITGSVGLAPFVGIAAFFIMTIWALGEALADVRALLSGKRVPLLKSKENWKLSLDQLLTMGGQGMIPESEGDGEGENYDGYLKLLLFLQKPQTQYYRLMDIIQMNIRRGQGDFSMEHCAYLVKIRGRAEGKHIFSFGNSSRYSMEVIADKAY